MFESAKFENVIFYNVKRKSLFNGPKGLDDFDFLFRGTIPEADFIPVVIKDIHHNDKKVYLGLQDIGVHLGMVKRNLSGNRVEVHVPGLELMVFETIKHVAYNNYVRLRYVEDEDGDIEIEQVLD